MSLSSVHRKFLLGSSSLLSRRFFSALRGSNLETIKEKLHQGLKPEFCEVINESRNHNVPPGSGTHFRVIIVSSEFTGANLVMRHRKVYQALTDEIRDGIHALALETYSPEEWSEFEGQNSNESPPCRGGSKL
ncbi:DNA-binding transcriptional regulator BolA-like [Brevipalpus obovatus]|uniref:DNA-binding transcriptional regulator BolA-like n=1 Tax=Brevipalpus obovatus TaxID=246614 RepID=UPI003D9EF7E6